MRDGVKFFELFRNIWILYN